MKFDKRTFTLMAVLAAAVLALTLIHGGGGNTLAFGAQDVPSANDAPVLEYEQAGGTAAPKAKKKHGLRQDRAIAELPNGIEPLPTSLHMWVGLPALPVAQSDAVVLGDVIDRHAKLTDDRMSVFSEFSIRIDTVFKDSQGLPGAGGAVWASRPGGNVRFASGKVQRYTASKLGYPQQGKRYVLFLKRDEEGDFSIITGYELRAAKVLPLDGSDSKDELQFAVYSGASQEAFLVELKKAVQAAAGGQAQ
jgi:hypothetical protein